MFAFLKMGLLFLLQTLKSNSNVCNKNPTTPPQPEEMAPSTLIIVSLVDHHDVKIQLRHHRDRHREGISNSQEVVRGYSGFISKQNWARGVRMGREDKRDVVEVIWEGLRCNGGLWDGGVRSCTISEQVLQLNLIVISIKGEERWT